MSRTCTSPSDDEKTGKLIDQSPKVPISRRCRHPERQAERIHSIEKHFQSLIISLETRQRMAVSIFEAHFKPIQTFLLDYASAVLRSLGSRNSALQADDAVQCWHINMITRGYASYRRKAAGRPFVPFGISALLRICLDTVGERKVFDLDRAEIGDSRLDPVKSTIDKENSARVHAAFEILRPEELEIIQLHFWDQIRMCDIASTLNLNPRTASIRRYRGLCRLRGELERRKGDFWPCERP